MKFAVIILLFFPLIICSQDLSDYQEFIKSQESRKTKEALAEYTVHGPINDSVYIVGPGDAFRIMLWGSHTNDKIFVVVNPEGNLIIPEMGLIKTDKSLREVKESITSLIKKKTRNIKDVIVELYNIKPLLISISGEVPSPGTYSFLSTVRLSDVIERSFQKSANILDSVNASLRNVQVVSGNGEKLSYDFVNYLKNGVIEDNPFLFSGNRVIVPFRTKQIIVTGAVVRQGYYDYRRESLYSLIQFCGGLRPGADSASISVTNFNADGFSINTHVLSYPEGCHDYIVKQDDYVVVGFIPNWHKQISARIFGQIRNPGTYNLKKGTTLSEFIDKAGGILEDGDLNISYLRRENFLYNAMEEDKGLEDILTKVYMSNINKLNIDFNKVLKGSVEKEKMLLQENDIVYIPRKTNNVSIIGCVVSPGLVDFKDGRHWKYYVKMAGDFDKRAFKSNTMLYRADKGAWVAAKDAEQINAGDVLFVPEKPELYTRNIVKDVFFIISGMTATVTTIVWIYIALKE